MKISRHVSPPIKVKVKESLKFLEKMKHPITGFHLNNIEKKIEE